VKYGFASFYVIIFEVASDQLSESPNSLSRWLTDRENYYLNEIESLYNFESVVLEMVSSRLVPVKGSP
jgi:hypothetical protein